MKARLQEDMSSCQQSVNVRIDATHLPAKVMTVWPYTEPIDKFERSESEIKKALGKIRKRFRSTLLVHGVGRPYPMFIWQERNESCERV